MLLQARRSSFVTITAAVAIYGAYKAGIVGFPPRSAHDELYVPYAGVSPVWSIGPLREVAMHFEPSVHYQLNSTAADEQWAALIPENGGLVPISGEGFEGPFMLSMFHQLRCLDILRRAYAHHEGNSALASHCLNYIRQMVFCRRDLHMEPLIAVGGLHTVQPWRTLRCLDWTQVYSAHRALNLDPNDRLSH